MTLLPARVLPVPLTSGGGVPAGSRGLGRPLQSAGPFAAASLTGVFTELGEQLEADNDGLTVQFNFAGSSALATQLAQGAPADVFASADPAQMATAANDLGDVARWLADQVGPGSGWTSPQNGEANQNWKRRRNAAGAFACFVDATVDIFGKQGRGGWVKMGEFTIDRQLLTE